MIPGDIILCEACPVEGIEPVIRQDPGIRQDGKKNRQYSN